MIYSNSKRGDKYQKMVWNSGAGCESSKNHPHKIYEKNQIPPSENSQDEWRGDWLEEWGEITLVGRPWYPNLKSVHIGTITESFHQYRLKPVAYRSLWYQYWRILKKPTTLNKNQAYLYLSKLPYLWQLESLWMYLKLQLADCSCCVNGRQLIISYLIMNCLWWLICFSMEVPITINKYTKNYCTVIGPIDLFVKIIYLLTLIKILYLRHRTLIKIVSSSLYSNRI